MKCPHADLMVEYAKDAQEYLEPWILWEYKDEGDEGWDYLTHHPRWYDSFIYRRKPQTVRFMGVKILDDVITSYDTLISLPKDRDGNVSYYKEDPYNVSLYRKLWLNPMYNCGQPDNSYQHFLEMGILHKTKHGAIDYTRLRHNLHRLYDDEGTLLKTEERENE